LGGVSKVANAIGALAKGIADALNGLVSKAAQVGRQIAGSISNGLSGATDAVSNAAQSTAQQAADAVTDAVDAAKNAGKAISDSIAGGVESNKDKATQAVDTVAGGIGQLLPGSDAEIGPLSTLTDVGPDLVRTVASGIRSEQATVLNAATETIGAIAQPLKQTPVGQLASTVAGEAASGLQAATDTVGLDIPGIQPQQQGGGDVTAETQAGITQGNQAQGGDGEITVEINQTFNIDGENASPQAVADAAEEGTRNAVNQTLKELERLLQQDLNA
jgi:phage-related protein